jgi:DME family drug/metabolite transporter
MALLEPLVGTVLAGLVLRDRLGPAGWAGAGLLLTALLLEPMTRRSGDIQRTHRAGVAEARYD